LLEGGFFCLFPDIVLLTTEFLSQPWTGSFLISVISLVILAWRYLFVCLMVYFCFCLATARCLRSTYSLFWLPIVRGWISLLRRLSATVLSVYF
jgi:hypothetical protein